MFTRLFKRDSVPRHQTKRHRSARLRSAIASILYWFRSKYYCVNHELRESTKQNSADTELHAIEENSCQDTHDRKETIAWLDSLNLWSSESESPAHADSDSTTLRSYATETDSDRTASGQVDRRWETDLRIFWLTHRAICNEIYILGAYKRERATRS